MGCYQEGIAKDSVAGKDVTAHIFEQVFFSLVIEVVVDAGGRYTTSVVVTETGEVSQGTCPVQVIFCLKEQNKKKLNSHRWFFNAFGPIIEPNGRLLFAARRTVHLNWTVCILLDVGTKPTGTSIYELWKCETTSTLAIILYLYEWL